MSLFQRYNAGYIQDDWRITARLTLNLGFRYEYTSPYGEKFGAIGYFDTNAVEPQTGLNGLFKWVPPGGYHSDPNYNTPGPRVGIAWQLDSKTVIRAAGAIFNAANNGLNAAATDFGTGLFTTNSVSLGAPNPLLFTPPVGGSWSNPFAAGFVFPQKGVTTFAGQSIRVDFRDHPLAYLANWTLSVQRQINNNTMAEVAYVGTKTTHLFWNRMDNANNPLLLEQYGSHLLDVIPNPFYGEIQGGVGAFPTIQRRQLLRPFPQYQQILAVRRPYGDASYQSMTARLEKSYSRGFTLSLGYTLSKLIASTAESNSWVIGPSNALYDPGYNRGLDANDTPHRIVISHVWDLPLGVGKQRLQQGYRRPRAGQLAVLGHHRVPGRAPHSHQCARQHRAARLQLYQRARRPPEERRDRRPHQDGMVRYVRVQARRGIHRADRQPEPAGPPDAVALRVELVVLQEQSD